MKKVFKVTTGYEIKAGGYDKSINSKNVLADTPMEAVEKVTMGEDTEVIEVLESVSLVCVIDIE